MFFAARSVLLTPVVRALGLLRLPFLHPIIHLCFFVILSGYEVNMS